MFAYIAIIQLFLSQAGGGRYFLKTDMENIFKPFYTTKSGGRGIVLVIAKRIVDSHHGRIDLTSQVGIRTVVKIQLPV
jgi:signal transduction histidine kinase